MPCGKLEGTQLFPPLTFSIPRLLCYAMTLGNENEGRRIVVAIMEMTELNQVRHDVMVTIIVTSAQLPCSNLHLSLHNLLPNHVQSLRSYNRE